MVMQDRWVEKNGKPVAELGETVKQYRPLGLPPVHIFHPQEKGNRVVSDQCLCRLAL
jgi:hypothetical protein